MSQALPTAPIMVVHIANVNGFVDNTPVLGYNVGGNILYRISKNISLKAGLEFSFSRYYINTYNSGQGQSAASLSSYFGYVADSLISMSNGKWNDRQKSGTLPEQILSTFHSRRCGYESSL